MIRGTKIIKKEIDLLFYGTPVVYAISKVIGNQSLYAIKDIWMMLLCVQIFISVRKVSINLKSLLLISVYFIYIIASSLLHIEDGYFWLISIREMVVTPLMLIILGAYLDFNNINFLTYSRKVLFFICALTVLFSFAFKSISYGATNRLNSLWDREHEPAIIGALLITATVAEIRRDKKKHFVKDLLVSCLLGGFCIIMSRSRSGILALFFSLIYIYADKLKGKNIVALVVLGIGGYFAVEYYSVITHRALNYNIGARLSQYSLARELIISYPLFGIGVDKYGVLGSVTKEFSYNGLSTITMDSDLIKYIVNLGLVYAILLITLLRKTYKYVSRFDRNAYIFVVFGLVMGAVTGKMGSYPMNQFFYPIFGYIIFTRDVYGNYSHDEISILSQQSKLLLFSK